MNKSDRKKLKIFIVDKHLIVRQSLRLLLNDINDNEIIGEASNAWEFLSSLNENTPDIALIDIDLPLKNGLETSKEAISKYPHLNIVAVSLFEEDEGLVKEKMEDFGIKGFFLLSDKEDTKEKLKLTLHQITSNNGILYN